MSKASLGLGYAPLTKRIHIAKFKKLSDFTVIKVGNMEPIDVTEQALNLKSNQTIYKISSDKQFNRIIEPVQVISISKKMVTLSCHGKYRNYLDTLDCYFLTEDEAKQFIGG